MEMAERVCAYYSKDGKCLLWDQTDKSNQPTAGTISDGFELECKPAVGYRRGGWKTGLIDSKYVSIPLVEKLIAEQEECDEYIPGDTTATELAEFYRVEKGIPEGIHIEALNKGEVPAEELKTGDEIVGIEDMFNLNRLIHVLGDSITNRFATPEDGKFYQGTTSRTYPSNSIQNDLEKRHFIGKVGHITVVMLEPDISFIRAPVRRDVVPESVQTFLAKVDILSNGHIFGTYFQETSVGLRRTDERESIVFGHKHLKGIAGTDVIDMLKLSSSANWTLARLQALARTTSGGLPTLGKHR